MSLGLASHANLVAAIPLSNEQWLPRANHVRLGEGEIDMPIHIAATVGRIVLGLYFLAAGAGKILGPLPADQIAHMTDHGIPAAELSFVLAGACETIAGICMIIGLHVRLVAALLAAFCVLVSIPLHAFWAEPQGHEKMVQMIMFMKNMATASGLLAFVGFGSGPLSVDRIYGVKD
jgi:putative oxidoreductase